MKGNIELQSVFSVVLEVDKLSNYSSSHVPIHGRDVYDVRHAHLNFYVRLCAVSQPSFLNCKSNTPKEGGAIVHHAIEGIVDVNNKILFVLEHLTPNWTKVQRFLAYLHTRFKSTRKLLLSMSWSGNSCFARR